MAQETWSLPALGLACLVFSSVPAAAQDGAALYRRDCAGCHDMGVDRAPARDALQTMTAERVLNALENGPMLSMASRETGVERRAIAQFVTGKSLSARDLTTTPPSSAMCAAKDTFTSPLDGPSWNGWGENTHNTRFQSGPAGLPPAAVPRLKVKWAFGFPGDTDANAQPTIVGGRVFVGSQGAKVYALSAESGCVHWFFDAKGSVRGAVTIGEVTTGNGRAYMAFFGDLSGNVYALNASTGALVWTMRPEAHPLARITASVVFYNGRINVPIASGEETAG